jgi:hypothetical protein
LFIPDTHVPYEDKRAFRLMLKVAADWRPDALYVGGDFSDCYTVSAHSKDPARGRLLRQEVGAVNRRLDQLDALEAREKHFIEGNHEDRLSRYLADKAPELFGLVSIPELFKLEQRGWTFTPYKQSRRAGKISITHDCGDAGAYAHYKALDTFQGNVVINHTHRLGITYVGNARGKSHVGAMFGWLGDVRRVDYMHRVKALRAWHLGFGVGYQEPGGVIHLQAIPIINYRCVVGGVLYKD